MHDARSLPRRVLIVRLGSMGDVLHALPAVHLLREAIPKCEIGWAIEERWLPLLSSEGADGDGATSPQRPLVNHLYKVDTRAWRKALFSMATYQEISSVVSAMRGDKYALALDFQGAIKSAVLAAMSGAESVIGFQEPREPAARMFYSHAVATAMVHVVERNFALARNVAGDARVAPKTILPVDATAEAWVTERLAELKVGAFAILAPTAGWKAKQWPIENFAVVATALAKRGCQSLINFGPGEERVALELSAASRGAAIPFACDLAQLIALTRRASLFIGGDTGPMHLAAAVDVPVVALFGPTDPARNGPYSTRAKVLRNPASVTSYRHVARRDEGLAAITPQEVIAAALAAMLA